MNNNDLLACIKRWHDCAPRRKSDREAMIQLQAMLQGAVTEGRKKLLDWLYTLRCGKEISCNECKDGETCIKNFNAVGDFIAGNRGGAVTITKEKIKQIVEKYVPCHCDPAYTGRGLRAPDCPRHAWVDETTFEEMLREAGVAGKGNVPIFNEGGHSNEEEKK